MGLSGVFVYLLFVNFVPVTFPRKTLRKYFLIFHP